MKVLVIDHDLSKAQKVRELLEPRGHQVFEDARPRETMQRLETERFDLIFLNAEPVSNARPFILKIRRSVHYYPYFVLMNQGLPQEEALKSGANDILSGPDNLDDLMQKSENAGRLTKLIERIGNDSEDFPSAGGVIAKSAFNQLLLSAADRADRYAEKTYLLFIDLRNYQQIRDIDGPYAADFAVAKLSQYLVLLRRQSDIIGQTAKNEYALMLQRPNNESEPITAAQRFAEALDQHDEIVSTGSVKVEIGVKLVNVPVGALLAEHVITATN